MWYICKYSIPSQTPVPTESKFPMLFSLNNCYGLFKLLNLPFVCTTLGIPLQKKYNNVLYRKRPCSKA